jgi:hypothetical protein
MHLNTHILELEYLDYKNLNPFKNKKFGLLIWLWHFKHHFLYVCNFYFVFVA